MSPRSVYTWVYANFLAVAMLFALGRHAGGSPVIFPILYVVVAGLTLVAALAVNRPGGAGFRLAFGALGAASVVHYALYILNERAMSAGTVEDNLLGYLYGLTFTVAIMSVGFVAKPEL